MRGLRVLPLTPARWPDLEAVFAGRGCSTARKCSCMFYRERGVQIAGGASARKNRAALKKLAAAGKKPGLLAYRDGAPVGWVALGPREDFAVLEHSPVMKAVDEKKVWSIVCFVVPSPFRGQGVARALLEGAIKFARKKGAEVLEAYPMDKKRRGSPNDMWFGAKSMYDKHGFEEVARRKPERPIVRLAL